MKTILEFIQNGLMNYRGQILYFRILYFKKQELWTIILRHFACERIDCFDEEIFKIKVIEYKNNFRV